MATLKLFIFKKQTKDNGECRIYVQIIHNRKVARIQTKYFVKPEHWQLGKVIGGKTGDRNAIKKNFDLSELLNDYQRTLIENEKNIANIDVASIREFLLGGSEFYETDFIKFTDKRIIELKKNKSPSARHMENTLTMIKNFHNKPCLGFNDINKRWLEGFVSYYQKKGHKINSIATYLRYIREIFNLAMDDFNTNPRNPVIVNYPFRKFKIRTEKTANRNLSIDVIRKIRDYEFKTKREEITKDVFLLQFYLLGTNIIDLFSMPKSAIVDGRLQFNRIKTKRFYNIKIEPEAKALIDKYEGKSYLFWFADNCKELRKDNKLSHSRQEEFQYSNSAAFNKMLNANLEDIQESLSLILPTDLTTYYTRHSFASAMREIGVSKDTISLALGHKDVDQNLKTSGIYISDDFIEIDLANRELIDFLNSEFTNGESWKSHKDKIALEKFLKEAQDIANQKESLTNKIDQGLTDIH